ncbi:Hypothetical predicted protein [Mytilus galloprovincialis]|uniref:B box-type domain-containing protein n=1 Tax=Mytilus galloprovincialis TaxID=29158 RepID=A0A8B6EIB8_MYTGA|nr:Hypothetical predicted protein [Mytilus galloprovincialis]
MGTASSVQRSQVPIGCQLCQGRNTIQWKCVNCQFLMCSICKDNIHLRIAKDHRIVNITDIGELDSGESFNFSDLHCNEHSNQVCCSYCRTCKTVVCLKCMMKVHNGHAFVDEEEFLSKKQTLWKGPKEAVIKLMELSKAETILKEVKKSEDALYMKAKQDIQERSTNDVDQFSEILIKLDKKMQSVNQGIDREIRNIDREKGKFQEVINVVDVIKSSKDFYKLFERFDELITTLNCEIVPFKSNIESISDFVEGEYLVSKFSQLKTNNSAANITFKVIKTFTTNIKRFHYLAELSDQTLLISDNKSDVLQHIKLEETNVKVISNFNIQIYGMAVSPSGDILISTSNTRLKVLNIKTGAITDSVYNVHSLHSRYVHVTKDNRVIIGALSPGPVFPAPGRRVVIVMDQEGTCLKEYEHDGNNKPLFTYPDSITTTINGFTFVVDWLDAAGRGRVVVLEQGGDVKQIYSGHPHINTERKTFKPRDLLTMSSGSVIVTDINTNTLHNLNNCGQLFSYHNLWDIGIIERPYSLSLSSSGHFYIGCTCKKGSPETYKAKLYELEYSGL